MVTERRWRYARIADMWSSALLVTVPLILGVAAAVQAGSNEGLGGRWLLVTLIGTVATGAVGYALMGGVAAPSSRLGLAEPGAADIPEPATPGEWRRWQMICLALATIGSLAMFLFLLATLGRGGLVEAAVAGVIAAVGLATRRDARRIDEIETREKRAYFSVGPSPTGAARRLVWTASPDG